MEVLSRSRTLQICYIKEEMEGSRGQIPSLSTYRQSKGTNRRTDKTMSYIALGRSQGRIKGHCHINRGILQVEHSLSNRGAGRGIFKVLSLSTCCGIWKEDDG